MHRFRPTPPAPRDPYKNIFSKPLNLIEMVITINEKRIETLLVPVIVKSL